MGWLYRIRPLTRLKMCAFFSVLNCLSLGIQRLRHFTAKGNSKFPSCTYLWVYCTAFVSIQQPCRIHARQFPNSNFMSTLFIRYIAILKIYLNCVKLLIYIYNFNKSCRNFRNSAYTNTQAPTPPPPPPPHTHTHTKTTQQRKLFILLLLSFLKR